MTGHENHRAGDCHLAVQRHGAGRAEASEELKAEIETKIQSAGVTSYTLEIVRNDEVSDPNMVVGSCENGTKKIIYQKNDD